MVRILFSLLRFPYLFPLHPVLYGLVLKDLFIVHSNAVSTVYKIDYLWNCTLQIIMLEAVAEKFRKLRCPFLEKIDVSSNKEWINGIFICYLYFIIYNFISRPLSSTHPRKEKNVDLVSEDGWFFFWVSLISLFDFDLNALYLDLWKWTIF